jgi:uncharacterized membrane protein
LSAFLLNDIKPWFLTEGKTCCYIHHNLNLGVPNNLAIKPFSGAVAGEEWKISTRGVFRTHILYFVLSFCFTLFLPASFYIKNQKN